MLVVLYLLCAFAYMIMASATAVRMLALEPKGHYEPTAFYVFFGLLWPLVVLRVFFDDELKP